MKQNMKWIIKELKANNGYFVNDHVNGKVSDKDFARYVNYKKELEANFNELVTYELQEIDKDGKVVYRENINERLIEIVEDKWNDIDLTYAKRQIKEEAQRIKSKNTKIKIVKKQKIEGGNNMCLIL